MIMLFLFKKLSYLTLPEIVWASEKEGIKKNKKSNINLFKITPKFTLQN